MPKSSRARRKGKIVTGLAFDGSLMYGKREKGSDRQKDSAKYWIKRSKDPFFVKARKIEKERIAKILKLRKIEKERRRKK